MTASLEEEERASGRGKLPAQGTAAPLPPAAVGRPDAWTLLLGPGAMLLSSLLFATMGVLVKTAARDDIPAAESTFVRFAAGLITVRLLARGGVIRVGFHRRTLLFVRG